MGHVFHQCYYHVVWTTKLREPALESDALRAWIAERVEAECWQRGGRPWACNAMAEHVHALVSLPPGIAVGTFVGQVKGGTAHAFNEHHEPLHLRWQEGYGVVTLRKSEAETVIQYIHDQRLIHAERRAWPTLECTEADND